MRSTTATGTPTSRTALRFSVAALLAATGQLGACNSSSNGGTVDAGGTDVIDVADAADGSAPDLVTPTSPTITVSAAAATTRQPTFFGENYWGWVPEWGDSIAGTEAKVQTLRLGVLRAGGANNDSNSPAAFTLDEVDQFVAYAKAVGAEPILQVPIISTDGAGTPGSAQAAADLVTYCNVTKGYGIKYWSIGNEPDLYDTGAKPGYTAANYCTDFAAFADAMKAVDSTIKILGPELSWKYQSGANDWLSPFLAACKDKVDVVTVHRYPFGPTATTTAAALGDAASFRTMIARLRSLMTAQGAGDKPLGITEANITYDGDPAKGTMPASPGTFYAAMWTADTLGTAMEAQLWTYGIWSIAEGWTLGLLDGSTRIPRPAFYAYQLLSEHLGPSVLTATLAPTGYSVYAGRNESATTTSLAILNRTNTTTRQLVSFDGLSVTLAPQAVDTPAESITVLEVNDDGTAHVWSYTAAIAAAAEPPTQVR